MPLLDKLKEPIPTTRSVDFLAALSWSCFAWWGIVSMIHGIPSISRASTELYQVIWGGWVGFSALVAMLAALSTFVRSTNRSRIQKKTVELVALVIFIIGVTVYPSVVIWTAIQGDPGYFAVAGPAVAYLLFPIWRVINLRMRIKLLKDYAG